MLVLNIAIYSTLAVLLILVITGNRAENKKLFYAAAIVAIISLVLILTKEVIGHKQHDIINIVFSCAGPLIVAVTSCIMSSKATK